MSCSVLPKAKHNVFVCCDARVKHETDHLKAEVSGCEPCKSGCSAAYQTQFVKRPRRKGCTLLKIISVQPCEPGVFGTKIIEDPHSTTWTVHTSHERIATCMIWLCPRKKFWANGHPRVCGTRRGPMRGEVLIFQLIHSRGKRFCNSTCFAMRDMVFVGCKDPVCFLLKFCISVRIFHRLESAPNRNPDTMQAIRKFKNSGCFGP